MTTNETLAGIVTVDRTDRVLTAVMDDGRANALSPTMLAALGHALDRAEADDVGAVVVAGRPGRFSGGFDLEVLGGPQDEALAMIEGGFELAHRLLSFPKPVVLGCTGHALAMGSFLLLAGDLRVGAAGEFRIQANEVAIGIPMPDTALALLRHRLTPPAFDRAVVLAEASTPESAVSAGWLDQVVAADDVVAVAQARAATLAATLDPSAHVISKLRARARVLGELRAAIDADFAP